MAEAIEVAPGVSVPPSAIVARSVRASGPGGQNVNKVASKVELIVDLDRIEGLGPEARARLEALARRRIVDGRLRVTAQDNRERARNLEAAREKVKELVLSALPAPKTRKRSRPGAGARARRLEEKHRHAEVKVGRRGVPEDGE